MAVALYMDAHIPRAVTSGLRLRGVDVITAQEDDSANLPDPALLERSATLRRVLCTFDDDLLVEAAKRQKEGIFFAGVIYAHPLNITIGKYIHELEIIAKIAEPEDLYNRVEFLPFSN